MEPVRSGKLIALLILMIFSAVSCLSGGPEEDKRYRAFPGTAVITEVVQARYDPGGDGMYLSVFYNFIPADPEAYAQHDFVQFPDRHVLLFVEGHGDLYKPWVEEMGILTGNEYKAVRYEKVKSFGRHPPVYYDVKIDKR